MRLVEELGQQQQVILPEAIRLLPVLALLVAPGGRHRVPGTLLTVVFPDAEFNRSRADLMNGLVGLGLIRRHMILPVGDITPAVPWGRAYRPSSGATPDGR